jgi:hypothetical protein
LDIERAAKHLAALFAQHRSKLQDMSWVSEADRWVELVFCIVHSFGGPDPQSAREAVQVLYVAGALESEALCADGDPMNSAQVVVVFVLRRFGYEIKCAERCATVLRHAAIQVKHAFGGHLQRFLRRHGEDMREDLVCLFHNAEIEESQLRYAVSHWLQNAVSLPISLQHPDVVGFCSEYGLDENGLESAVDELNINLAVVDDVLSLEAARVSSSTGEEEES